MSHSLNKKILNDTDIYIVDTYGETQKFYKISNPVFLGGSLSLIITSPPYLNTFDYYLYHKLRIVWLGFSPKLVKGHLYLHHLDIQTQIEPLAAGMPALGRVVVIDTADGSEVRNGNLVYLRVTEIRPEEDLTITNEAE